MINLLGKLPSIDLAGRLGWNSVIELPQQPGCYAVVVTIQRRQQAAIAPSQATKLYRFLAHLMGNDFQSMAQAVNGGGQSSVILYVGYSKNLRQRWAGRNPHHKKADLEVVGSIFHALFDVRSLRLFYGLLATGEQAKALETQLIKAWRPVLNGRKALVSA